MKSLLTICAGIILCTASCAAQSTPKPARPSATVAEIPDTPTPPATALAAETDPASDQVRSANDEAAKLKSVWAVGDLFGTREEAMHTLALPKDGAQVKNQAETEQELKLMAHILEKAAVSGDERNARAVGIYYRSPFGISSPMRNLYLEGYGAIFFMNVNYPLTPPATKADVTEPKEDRDAEWEEARREVTETRSSRSDFALAPGQTIAAGVASEGPEYDAEKVESLQKNLAQ